MWQQLIVFCIVAAAAVHAGAKYLPASWRRRLVVFLTRRGTRQSKMGAWLKPKSGCGDGCSSCHSCSHPAPVEKASSSRIEVQPRQ